MEQKVSEKPDPYALKFFSAMFAFCVVAGIGIRLINPDFAPWDVYAFGSIIIMILAGLIGGVGDLVVASRETKAIPERFINYLYMHVSIKVKAAIDENLEELASECKAASADSIKFQSEKLSGNGRASTDRDLADIERTEAFINKRVKAAMDQFYTCYDAVAPYQSRFGELRERNFKQYI